jgi:hypothetical protein
MADHETAASQIEGGVGRNPYFGGGVVDLRHLSKPNFPPALDSPDL